MDLLKCSVETTNGGKRKREVEKNKESTCWLNRVISLRTYFMQQLLNLTIHSLFMAPKWSNLINCHQEKTKLIYTYFQSKKLTSAKIALILVIKEMGYTNEHWHVTNMAALSLEPISNSQNGDWERGHCPHYLYMKAPQNDQAKIFLLFECHGCIKVCVCCAIIWISSNRWNNNKMGGKHS